MDAICLVIFAINSKRAASDVKKKIEELSEQKSDPMIQYFANKGAKALCKESKK